MSKPICPKQSFNSWTKSPVGKASLRFVTLEAPPLLNNRIKLAYMAGFDAGSKAEHKKGLVKRKKPAV
jgi:hypothetical protein